MARQGTDEELARADAIGRRLGVGCFTMVTGGASGAMISVLIGNIVGYLSREPECEGVPICDWYVWVAVGGLLGAISLTIFIQMRLARPKDEPPVNTDRG